MRSIKLSSMLFLAGAAFGALPAGVQWDIRTTGSDVNGGGFVAGASGTDWSQQNTAHTAYTDLVVGATTTLATSVAHPFGATDVGNLIQIVSGTGCTTGFFQVVSVSVITATLDRSAGTAASVCTANLGGSLLTIAKCFTPTVDGNTVNLKAGTYTLTAAATGPNVRYIFSGYNATHGDMGTKPLITTATNSTELLNFGGTASRALIINIAWSNTASVRAAAISQATGAGTAGAVFVSCIFDGFTTALAFDSAGAHKIIPWLSMTAVEIKNSSSHAVLLVSASVSSTVACTDCYIHNNTGDGITTTGSGAPLVSISASNSIFAANANGINNTVNGGYTAVQSCDFASNTAAGVAFVNGSVQNSIFDSNTTYGINGSSVVSTFGGFAYTNAYRANGTAPNQNITETGAITLTANPFTSSTNFALNSTAGGGAALKGVGFPGAFIGGTTTSAIDVGAVQSTAAAAGAVSSGFVQ